MAGNREEAAEIEERLRGELHAVLDLIRRAGGAAVLGRWKDGV
jgi:hypothetical protein